MLKLTLKPGQYIDIGEDIRIVFSGGSSNNIHLLVDAPREVPVKRSNAGGNTTNSGKRTEYYSEKQMSQKAKREITEIIMREKRQSGMGTLEK
jgi:carbon storage regulator